MQVNTKAIVLSAIKYGDTSLIVRCYTEKAGVRSYMLRGVLKSRKGKIKSAYFQPLSQLELTASHNNKGTLNSIKEARVVYPYESLYIDMIKQSIAFFLSEMLSNSVQEEEGNTDLYSYIETSLKWLDIHNSVSNFHLVFLINLTKYLGFYPDEANSDSSSFNLVEGKFTNEVLFGKYIFGRDLELFKMLLGITFDVVDKLSFDVNSRQRLLEIIVVYFELHLTGFKKPKSIQILKELFS